MNLDDILLAVFIPVFALACLIWIIILLKCNIFNCKYICLEIKKKIQKLKEQKASRNDYSFIKRSKFSFQMRNKISPVKSIMPIKTISKQISITNDKDLKIPIMNVNESDNLTNVKRLSDRWKTTRSFKRSKQGIYLITDLNEMINIPIHKEQTSTNKFIVKRIE